jgi:ATP-dependent helicase YprA (DUF1998 family)
MNHFVSPVGNVELDNDCPFSIDLRSTRSRESISKEDIPFYFKQFIEPKYGLNNINVTNVASFMKDLEMNWTKLTPDLKDKVLDIMVDGILNDPKSNYDFKNKLLENPHYFQVEAYEKLKSEKRSILALPCGIGKTLTAMMIGDW